MDGKLRCIVLFLWFVLDDDDDDDDDNDDDGKEDDDKGDGKSTMSSTA